MDQRQRQHRAHRHQRRGDAHARRLHGHQRQPDADEGADERAAQDCGGGPAVGAQPADRRTGLAAHRGPCPEHDHPHRHADHHGGQRRETIGQRGFGQHQTGRLAKPGAQAEKNPAREARAMRVVGRLARPRSNTTQATPAKATAIAASSGNAQPLAQEDPGQQRAPQRREREEQNPEPWADQDIRLKQQRIADHQPDNRRHREPEDSALPPASTGNGRP